MSEGGGSQGKLGPDTSGKLAIARTVPSDARIDAVASAETILAVPPAEPSSPSQRGERRDRAHALDADGRPARRADIHVVGLVAVRVRWQGNLWMADAATR